VKFAQFTPSIDATGTSFVCHLLLRSSLSQPQCFPDVAGNSWAVSKKFGKNWLLDSKNHVYDGLCNCSLTSFSFFILTYVLSTLRLCEAARIDLNCWLVVATSFPMNESWKLQKGNNDCRHAERLRLHFPPRDISQCKYWVQVVKFLQAKEQVLLDLRRDGFMNTRFCDQCDLLCHPPKEHVLEWLRSGSVVVGSLAERDNLSQ
jgi:hypothetical protein